jgi:hypothetical protein
MGRLLDYNQLHRKGLMPYSRGHLNRLKKQGRYANGVRFGGPKSKEFWDEDYAQQHIDELKAEAGADEPAAAAT